jgi:CheY-like chemotaxis protein
MTSMGEPSTAVGETPAPALTPGRNLPHRVLVVEDEPENRLFIGLMLRTEGYEVLEAEDGHAALEALQRGPLPELILLDVMMPGLNGWQVFQRIRENSQWSRIPVVMLTALAQRADVERAVELGVDGYLTKPFEPADLIHTMEETLSRKSV